MEQNIEQEQSPVPAPNKVVFGAVNAPTPMWANWTFRIVITITTVITFWVGITKVIPDGAKFEIAAALKSIDMLVWGFGRLLGVVPDEK